MLIQELQDLIDKEKFQAIAKERKKFARWLSSKRSLDGRISREDRDAFESGYTPAGYENIQRSSEIEL